MVQALELFGVLICLFGFLTSCRLGVLARSAQVGICVFFSLFFYFRQQGCGGDVMSSVVSAG
jgi:hypothetical protein